MSFRVERRVSQSKSRMHKLMNRDAHLRSPTAQRSSRRKSDTDALPFGWLWYAEPNAITKAIGYAKFDRRSHDAVIRVYDEAGNVIETHKHAGDFKEGVRFVRVRSRTLSKQLFRLAPAGDPSLKPLLKPLLRNNRGRPFEHEDTNPKYQ
jgi:hypothetical protein